MSARHTPGPWVVADDHPKRAAIYIKLPGPYGHEIASLYSGPSDAQEPDKNGVWGNDPERMANANLIAAAPELLEALADIAEYPELDAIELKRIARAAIAKATGEQA